MNRAQFPPVALTVFFLATLSFTPVFADAPTHSRPERTVFIDPGHGGEDSGARGPGGTLEKNVTLQLARLVLDKLDGNYRFRLSRSNDYHVDIFKISGLANEAKADVFLSFHVGSSFRPNEGGFYLYYSEIPVKPEGSARLSVEHASGLTRDREPWRGVQRKHCAASRQLARNIRNRLSQISGDPTLVAGADALVLAGADMPAILIEIGCLANSSDEKKIRNVDYLARIADAISAGINDFLGDNSAISPMDLRQ